MQSNSGMFGWLAGARENGSWLGQEREVGEVGGGGRAVGGQGLKKGTRGEPEQGGVLVGWVM